MGFKVSCQVGGRGQKKIQQVGIFSQKKASQVEVKFKSELLDQKSLASPNCFNFEFFDHDPQLDMKV